MNDKPVKQLRLYQIVTDRLEQEILNRTYRIGERIPDEITLGKKFGVSRTVIREAINTLINKGLILSRPGIGAVVVDSTDEALRHSIMLAASMNSKNGVMQDLMEIREIFEPSIVYHAAARATLDDINQLEELIRGMDENINSKSKFIELDGEFHLMLAKMTNNILIEKLFYSVVSALDKFREKIFLVKGGPERGQEHHKNILLHIRNRDCENAQKSMIAHLNQIRTDREAGEKLNKHSA